MCLENMQLNPCPASGRLPPGWEKFLLHWGALDSVPPSSKALLSPGRATCRENRWRSRIPMQDYALQPMQAPCPVSPPCAPARCPQDHQQPECCSVLLFKHGKIIKQSKNNQEILSFLELYPVFCKLLVTNLSALK